MKNVLDLLLWEVSEYRKLRILKIYEKEKIIVVLIKSNTKLEHTIDNILGYYFESDVMMMIVKCPRVYFNIIYHFHNKYIIL